MDPWQLGILLVICGAIVLYGLRRSIRDARKIDALASDRQEEHLSTNGW
jgi:hypothetical protein